LLQLLLDAAVAAAELVLYLLLHTAQPALVPPLAWL
jgi:hypothetical protein